MLRKLLLLTPASMLVMTLATMPVQARNGADDSITTPSTSGPTNDTSSRDGTVTHETEVHPEAEVETHTTDPKQVESHNKAQGIKLIEQEMHQAKAKKHTIEERQKNCKVHENGLETKLANLGKNADKHKVRIDGILQKAEAFYNNSSAKPAGAVDLLAEAQAAQQTSAASVTALKALNVNLDCNNPGVAENVATFKVAAAQARSDLLTYRGAVKSLLKSLQTDAKDGVQQ